MKLILKFAGVPSHKIGPLHSLLEQPTFHGEFESHWHRDRGPEIKKVDWAKIIRSKSDNGIDYTIDIELTPFFTVMNFGRATGKNTTIFPSINILRRICEILEVYPDEQKMMMC